MNRKQGIALLKEITERHLVEPSFASIEKNHQGSYNLIIRGDCKIQELKELLAEKNLTIEWDKDYFTIFEH